MHPCFRMGPECSLFFSVATPKSFAFYSGWISSCHWWLSFEPFWICHQIDKFKYIKCCENWEKATNLHLQHPNMQYSWLAETLRLCVHMWHNDDAKTCSNLPQKSTSTTGIKNMITSLPLWIELRQADSFEHWLVMYFLKYVF